MTDPSAPEEIPELSDEQELALVKIVQGKNLLITGNAGTGKSTLMRRVIELIGPAVAASTGVAALQIGGETIHSWSGIGIMEHTAAEVVRNLEGRARQWGDQTLGRMIAAKTLIIDEISMLSSEALDLLDAVLCLARQDERPFGGLQMVMVGDFCFAEGTQVLMFDGSLRCVEDVLVGDEVMGPDSKPRKVTCLFRGDAPLYRVDQANADSYTVTGNHQLTLVRRGKTEDRYPSLGNAPTMSVADFTKTSARFREVFGGYKAGVISFPEKALSIDPYFLGVWLGDGEHGSVRVSTPEPEIRSFLADYAGSVGLVAHEKRERDTPCFRVSITKGYYSNEPNRLLDLLRSYNLIGNKHIPEDFLVNSEANRLALLAGLLDTDGCWSGNRFLFSNTNQQIISDVYHLACHLGFRCSIRRYKSQGFYGDGPAPEHATISIGGDTWRIPTKVVRKQSHPRELGRSRLNSTLSVTPVGDGVFAGFAVDGDRLFVLADGTVVHNCQLPPVDRTGKAKFAFKAKAWEDAGIEVSLLTKVFRQEEERFSRVLNHIRFDRMNDEVEEFLRERFAAEDPDPTRPACILHTHNDKCDQVNRAMLRDLPGDVVELKARDEGKHENFVKQIERDCLAPTVLSVKPGARVMLLVNLDTRGGLVNGSMGHVIGTGMAGVRVRFDNGREELIERKEWEFKKGGVVVARRAQFPLRLARAYTIHRSQGMSLDKVETDLSRCFAPGQAYVALSRARTSDGLFLRGTGVTIEAHPEAVKFYQQHCQHQPT